MINKITLELVKDEWEACWPRERIAKLYPEPRTPLEVLTMTGGEWDTIKPKDRFWTVLRSDVLPDELLCLFVCWCAEQALPIFEKHYPNDSRPRVAIETARKFAAGEATREERAAAGDAASAAWAAAWAATGDAARAAARAAWAARAAARDAAWAARDAGDASAAQLAKLIEMVTIWVETGDVFGGEREGTP